MSTSRKPRLGRGLSSLMASPVAVQAPPPDQQSRSADNDLRYVPIDAITPNPHQPRQRIEQADLETLAQSIRQDGVMQPIIVRPAEGRPDHFELVAGERRWRAARLAGLTTIPAICRQLDDRQIAEWALIENLQRRDLDAIERAHAFKRLTEQFHLQHDQVADRVGIDRVTVTNTLRLLDLPESTQQAIRDGLLTAGHGRAILTAADHEARRVLTELAIAQGWSVRRIEAAVRHATPAEQPPKTKRSKRPSGAHLDDVAQQIAEQLKTKVTIRPSRRKGAGTLLIDFYDLDQFDELMRRMDVRIM